MNLIRPFLPNTPQLCTPARGRWLTLTVEAQSGRLPVTDITPDPNPSILDLASPKAVSFNWWIEAELVPVEETRRCMGLEASRDEGKAILR